MLQVNLKEIPAKIGVYLFKDKNGNVLYVGKAVNLRERIRNHLKSSNPKIIELIKSADDLEYIVLDSEAEALLKEAELIKKFDPPFNQLLRDDTQYFYVGFTKEKYPKVFITHQPQKYNAEFIGPFTEGTALRKILRIIRKEIPFCTCLKSHYGTCLNASLGLCYGWCCKEGELGDERLYSKNIQKIKRLLKGDLKKIKKELLNELEKAINEDNLDKATKIKKEIQAINKILEHTNLIKEISKEQEKLNRIKILKDLQVLLKMDKLPNVIEVYDISHFAGNYKVGIMVVFKDGIYSPKDLRKFRIKTVMKPDDPRMIYEVLKRRFNHPEWGIPDLILIDGGKVQFSFANKALKEAGLYNVKIISIAKPKSLLYYDENKKPITLSKLPKNLADFIKLLDKITHRKVINYHRRLREKQWLNF
jgi:excinuclease ABC subunit C